MPPEGVVALAPERAVGRRCRDFAVDGVGEVAGRKPRMETPGVLGVAAVLVGAVVAGRAASLGLAACVPAVAAAAALRRSAGRVGRPDDLRFPVVVVGGVVRRRAVAAVPGLAAARSAADRSVGDCARCRIARPNRVPRPRTNRPRVRDRSGDVSTRSHRLDQDLPPRDDAPTGRDLRTVANARADRHPPTNLAFPSSLPPRPWLCRLRRFRNDNDSATTGHPSANRTLVGAGPSSDAEKLLGLGLLGSISVILAARKFSESSWFAALVRISAPYIRSQHRGGVRQAAVTTVGQPPLCMTSAAAGTAGSSGSSSHPCGSATLPGEPCRPRGPSASGGNGAL